MKCFVFLVAAIQATLIEVVNHERKINNVTALVSSPILDTFLKRFIVVNQKPERYNATLTLAELLGHDICHAFPIHLGCEKVPAQEFMFANHIPIISIPAMPSATEQMQFIKENSVEDIFLNTGNFSSPLYKTIGEAIDREVHYIILSPY
ncbi:hypothetical protein DSO57_1005289 [Entomophthora muscae]|uniref:Uncharacterized protein n=1 Tax=Entomophthora muscae TaxID=34485 RepID=A0ACC2TIT4_9FUNG|nr:hypothetical protein DSO57_1005289 [Entomophthora muscae]